MTARRFRLTGPLGTAALLFLTQPAAAQQPTTITMGETSPLGYADSGNGNFLAAQSAALLQPGTIQSISFWVQSASGHLLLGLYDASGPGGGPGGLLTSSAPFSTTSNAWNTANVQPVHLAAPAYYWLAFLPQRGALAFRKGMTSGITNAGRSHNFRSGMPTIFPGPTLGSDGFHWMLYATLTADPPPPPGQSVTISFDPPNPSIPDNASIGTPITNIIVTVSDGSPFSGSLGFGQPYGSDAGFCAIQGNQVILGAVPPPGASTQQCTITASQ